MKVNEPDQFTDTLPTSQREASERLVVFRWKATSIWWSESRRIWFQSWKYKSNPLFVFHFCERLRVIPGLVGGWLADSCTATHSWSDRILWLSPSAQLQSRSCPTGWCAERVYKNSPFRPAWLQPEAKEAAHSNQSGMSSSDTFRLWWICV